MGRSGCRIILRKESDSDREIGTSANREPVEGANEGLVGSNDGTLNGKILISQPSSGQWGSLGVWWCIETLLETGYCMMMT